jgi:hypothetical protein
VELNDVFPLPPDVEREIRPEALKHYNEWRVDILKDVPELSQLSQEESEADIRQYLTDAEKARLQKYLIEIAEWSCECTRNKHIPFFISIPIVHLPMLESRHLIRQVYERKAQEAEEKRMIEAAKVAEEEKKKECDRRVEAAKKALNPPIDKAESYLNADEFKQFFGSAAEAVVAYALCGEGYVRDPRSLPYLRWLDEIGARQNEQERQQGAREKAQRYNHSLNNEVTRLKAELYKEKQDTESYLKAHVGGGRYFPQSFAFKLLPQDQQKRDTIVKKKVDEIVPQQYIQFIRTRYRTRYYHSPFAEFCAEDVLLLNFFFKVYAVAEIEIWLEPGEVTIDDYVFAFPWVEHGSDYETCLTKEQKPELLGYRYLLFTPSDLGQVFWKSLPLVLVKGLMAGEVEPEGTSIIESGEKLTTYTVDGYDNDVVVPERFTEYLKEVGGIEGMVTAGVINKKVAEIIMKRLAQPLALPTPQSPRSRSISSFGEVEFISTLTSLGLPRRYAEDLLQLVPRNLPLSEATRIALQKYRDLMSNKGNNENT